MNKRVRKARWRKMVLVFTYYCSPSSISSWWLASLLLTYSVSSFIFLKAGGNHFPEWVWSCANSVLFSHCYWPCFSPEVWELQSFVWQILTIHWSTKSPSHYIKEIPNISFNTTEDDPTVLVAEVSSHGSHECNLEKCTS